MPGQGTNPATLEMRLAKLFPEAASFLPKDGSPTHFTAYAASTGAGEKPIAGYAFWTTELDPLERGYDGPIQVLARGHAL